MTVSIFPLAAPGGTEVPSPTAPESDPALFGAALLAALQAAVPAPLPPVEAPLPERAAPPPPVGEAEGEVEDQEAAPPSDLTGIAPVSGDEAGAPVSGSEGGALSVAAGTAPEEGDRPDNTPSPPAVAPSPKMTGSSAATEMMPMRAAQTPAPALSAPGQTGETGPDAAVMVGREPAVRRPPEVTDASSRPAEMPRPSRPASEKTEGHHLRTRSRRTEGDDAPKETSVDIAGTATVPVDRAEAALPAPDPGYGPSGPPVTAARMSAGEPAGRGSGGEGTPSEAGSEAMVQAAGDANRLTPAVVRTASRQASAVPGSERRRGGSVGVTGLDRVPFPPFPTPGTGPERVAPRGEVSGEQAPVAEEAPKASLASGRAAAMAPEDAGQPAPPPVHVDQTGDAPLGVAMARELAGRPVEVTIRAVEVELARRPDRASGVVTEEVGAPATGAAAWGAPDKAAPPQGGVAVSPGGRAAPLHLPEPEPEVNAAPPVVETVSGSGTGRRNRGTAGVEGGHGADQMTVRVATPEGPAPAGGARPRSSVQGRAPAPADAPHPAAGRTPPPEMATAPADAGMRAGMPAVSPQPVVVAEQEATEPAPVSGFPGKAPVSGRDLPASRQELPNAGEPGAGSGRDRTTAERPRARAASDAPSEGFLPVAQREAGVRRDEGARAAGEARNLPERGEPGGASAGHADRVTVRVADADGRATRIRVTVMGDQVRAVIQPPDAETARQLERRMDDLQTALVRQGYAGARVTVRLPGAAEGGTPWGGTVGGTTGEATGSRAMERPAGEERQGGGRREPERQEGGEGRRQAQQRFRERDPRDRRR